MTAVLPVRRPGAALQLPPGEADTTPAAGRWNGRARHLVARAYPWFARVAVAVAAMLFLLLAIGPHVLGYRTMTMLTGSMAPQINPGDVVVSTPVATRDLRPGLVITYHIPIDDHRVVTHRIVSIQQGTDGSVTVQTKGDANKAADPWKATLRGDTVFQVRAVIPELGYGIEALRAPAVRTVLVYGAPALLAGWLLMGIWRKDDENDIDTDDVDSDEREKEGSA